MTKYRDPKTLIARISKEQEDQALKDGNCPLCKRAMQPLECSCDYRRGELYCEGCHLSIRAPIHLQRPTPEEQGPTRDRHEKGQPA